MRVYLNILILKLFYFLIVVPNSWQCDIGVYNGKGQTYKIIEESPTNIPGCREDSQMLVGINGLKYCLAKNPDYYSYLQCADASKHKNSDGSNRLLIDLNPADDLAFSRSFDYGSSEFCKESFVKSCVKANINPDLLGETLELPGNIELKFINKVPGDENAYNYEGNDAVLIITYNPVKKTMQGLATLGDGRAFNLEYVGDGVHLWKEMDLNEIKKLEYGQTGNRGIGHGQDDTVDMNVTENTANRMAPEIHNDNTTMVYISVRFYFTPQFLLNTPDVFGFVAKIVAVTNQGYKNSKVPITIVVHCIEPLEIAEVYSSLEQITNFVSIKGDHYKDILGSADAATLLVSGENFSSCGTAFTNVALLGFTFSVVTKSCADTNYSFGHEIGHNMGCAHNVEDDNKPSYPYGFGYFFPSGQGKSGFRSIMAYAAPNYPTRTNYFSNPDVVFPETGTSTGVHGRANNVAVMLKNRFSMAKVGDESTGCNLAWLKNAKVSK